jgi:hypothetical protein
VLSDGIKSLFIIIQKWNAEFLVTFQARPDSLDEIAYCACEYEPGATAGLAIAASGSE